MKQRRRRTDKVLVPYFAPIHHPEAREEINSTTGAES
jgi:hypothetical protein